MPYVWWHSGYDLLCHAFSADQSSDVYYEAVCTHSVPTDLVVRELAGPLCVPCLLKVGSALPDHSNNPATWQD